MDIDSDFQKFKEECEKDDSEIRECENQRKLVKQNKMCLIKFDSQLHETQFKLFLEKYIGKIVNVVRSTSSRKAPSYICDEALDTDNFDQCTKFILCEKAEEIVPGFCSKHSEFKKILSEKIADNITRFHIFSEKIFVGQALGANALSTLNQFIDRIFIAIPEMQFQLIP